MHLVMDYVTSSWGLNNLVHVGGVCNAGEQNVHGTRFQIKRCLLSTRTTYYASTWVEVRVVDVVSPALSLGVAPHRVHGARSGEDSGVVVAQGHALH